ncbi:ABC transporter ATP-binding protein [uncultured Anaerococcus sp.]|uniref:ABC transporter ATP-binding protein n=1 Tax=uncultured Anaerococcus sp. TaxID=293428 RepID=UPI0025FFBE89|nr:ABC transporter ATP-binding protein [uncultured Anaerococcus sp.]
MSDIKLENIRKVYKSEEKKEVIAVKDFNLEVKDGEFIVLVGPSGCGKSTALRMIAGLEDITSGRLIIDEKVSNDLEPKERDIAMVFQTYALYPHMTVFENLEFPLEMEGIKKEDRKEKVEKVAKKLQIEEYLKRKPKALSGGQRQRVAIGRALVRNPKVLLMDEPLSNLDAKLRTQMRSEIINLRSQIDSTFIYVTHDQTEAMTLGDRIVVMKDGIIQQVDTPSELYDNPKNLFVATFIGTPQINLLDTKLLNNKEMEIMGKTIDISSKNKTFGDDLKDIDIIVGVRPELSKFWKDEEFFIEAKYEFVEMLGGQMHIHFSVQNKDFVIVESKEKYDFYNRNLLKKGEKERLTFDLDKSIIFDGQSHENLEF